MPNFILTRSSVILCPHGGIVTHIPLSANRELINGELPMLVNDQFFVAGCPFMSPMGPMPCLHVIWTNASITKLINGVPVLTNASIGMVHAVNSMPQGIVVIASFQTQVTD
jgi:hypothetical protein